MAAASPSPQPTKTCNSRNHRGGICALTAGWGTDHPGLGRCKFHGGASPAGRVYAAKLRVAELVQPAPITGIAAVERALALINGLVTALEAETAAGQLVSRRGELHPLVRQLMAASRDLAQVGKLAKDAEIAERQIALDEQQAELVTDVVRAIFGDLGIEIDDRVADVVQLRVAERQAA